MEDISVHDGAVGHQHVDFVFYGAASSRDVSPAADEAPPDAWRWFSAAELADERARLEPDVIEIGRRAIEHVGDE